MIERISRVVLLSVALSLLLAITSLPCLASDGLQMKIWTEKSEFLTHEPIIIHCQVTNTGDKRQCMNLAKMKENFIIEDDQGKRYYSHLKGMSMGGDILEPGEMCHTSVEVSGLYSAVNVAKYTCYCRTVACASVLNSQRVTSDTIQFQVNKPEGDEEKALSLLLEAEKLVWARSEAGGPDLAKREVGFLKYQELADKYPESVYTPKALRAAIGAYLHLREHRRRVIPVCLRLIEEYPNSYYWASGFSRLIGTYEVEKDKAGAIKTMQELIDKHPNTKISERADSWLEKIEKWEF